MLAEIERFVNWVRRCHPGTRPWKDYSCDLRLFARTVGSRSPEQVSVSHSSVRPPEGHRTVPASYRRTMNLTESPKRSEGGSFGGQIHRHAHHRHVAPRTWHVNLFPDRPLGPGCIRTGRAGRRAQSTALI